MPAQIFTDSERPDLFDRLDELEDPWPEFIHHDEVVVERWPLLHEQLPDFQLILYDPDTDTVLGRGCTIPVSWDGRNETLSGGVVDVLVQAFADSGAPTSCARWSPSSTPASKDAAFPATSSVEWPRPPAAPASSA